MSTDLATVDAPVGTVGMLMNPTALQALVTFAEMMAKSVVTVPKHLQGKPSDCMAIAMQAVQWDMNPFAVAQKTHLVNGVLGYEAQLVNAVVQNSGAIIGTFKYEYQGSGANVACRVGALLRGDQEVTWGPWLSAAEVTTKNSPLWKTNPAQQLGYLQVKNFSRLYCPGPILGIYSDDELVDYAPIGSRNMGTVEEVTKPTPAPTPALPEYAAADFDKNLPAWTKLVATGKKSAPDLLATLSTKATFSEEQKAAILSLKVAPQPEPTTETPPPPADDGDERPWKD